MKNTIKLLFLGLSLFGITITRAQTVTGTGTTNTLPKFTGASTLGNSNITDNGTVITLATDATVNGFMLGRGNGATVSNTVFGYSALNASVSSSRLTAIGWQALSDNVTGAYITSVGSQALRALLQETVMV